MLYTEGAKKREEVLIFEAELGEVNDPETQRKIDEMRSDPTSMMIGIDENEPMNSITTLAELFDDDGAEEGKLSHQPDLIGYLLAFIYEPPCCPDMNQRLYHISSLGNFGIELYRKKLNAVELDTLKAVSRMKYKRDKGQVKVTVNHRKFARMIDPRSRIQSGAYDSYSLSRSPLFHSSLDVDWYESSCPLQEGESEGDEYSWRLPRDISDRAGQIAGRRRFYAKLVEGTRDIARSRLPSPDAITYNNIAHATVSQLKARLDRYNDPERLAESMERCPLCMRRLSGCICRWASMDCMETIHREDIDWYCPIAGLHISPMIISTRTNQAEVYRFHAVLLERTKVRNHPSIAVVVYEKCFKEDQGLWTFDTVRAIHPNFVQAFLNCPRRQTDKMASLRAQAAYEIAKSTKTGMDQPGRPKNLTCEHLPGVPAPILKIINASRHYLHRIYSTAKMGRESHMAHIHQNAVNEAQWNGVPFGSQHHRHALGTIHDTRWASQTDADYALAPCLAAQFAWGHNCIYAEPLLPII